MKKHIIAHRGHPPVYHENTLLSFQSAVDHGADYIEFDVRRTADEQLIAFHDPSIEHNGVVSQLWELTYEEIQSIAATKNFSVPLIEDIFTQFSDKILFDIELKEPDYEHVVVDLLHRFSMPLDKTIFTSFLIPVLTTLKHINPAIKTGFLFETENMFESCNSLIVDYYCPEKSLFLKHRDFFVHAAGSGIKTAIWTVDALEHLSKFLKDPCIDAVITNRCDLARKLYTL